jgi:2-aminoethylphosphonate transport system substrate-binding protein
MLMSFKLFGGTSQGFDYLKQLQANNLGPSSSTGRLAALVNKGEMLVANGDVQMNYAQMTQYPAIKIAVPAGPDGKKTAMALPYHIGLVKGAPHSTAGQELIAFLLSQSAQDRVYDLAGGFRFATTFRPPARPPPPDHRAPCTIRRPTAMPRRSSAMPIWSR